MDNHDAGMIDERTEAEAAFDAARWRVASKLAAATLMVFVSFLLMVGFARPLLGTVLVPGLTLGILLGVLLLYGAWAVAGIYVHWANGHAPDEAQILPGS